MTERVAVSADGVKHRFPENTPDDVIDRVMRQYALEQTPPNMSDMTPEALERSNTKAATEAVGLLPDRGAGTAIGENLAQGAALNLGDNTAGGWAAMANLLGLGKPGESIGDAYRNERDSVRKRLRSDQAFHPVESDVSNVGGQVGTGLLSGTASGVKNIFGLMGLGGAEGAASNVGASDSSDPLDLAKTGSIGFLTGAAGAGMGGGIPRVAGELTPSGLAYKGIQAATDEGRMLPDVLARMKANGSSAAEADEIMRDVLHGQSQKNATAAVAALPAARTRLAEVNKSVQDSVNRVISPDNAQLLLNKLKKDAQDFASTNYGIAHANEGTVGLMPDLAKNPGMQPAIDAAKELAAMEGRSFDVTSLTVKDLDAMQRALKGETEQLFKEGGAKTIFGAPKSQMREDVNNLAKAMSQEFADVQRKYAQNASQRESVKLGSTALSPSKEAAEVAAEYASLPSDLDREAYRAAVATKARTLLAAKRPNANASAALSPEGIMEKLKAVGFPEEELQAQIEKGTAARGVVDALKGGSDTARNLAAAKATESVMSDIKPGTLLAGIMGNPAFIPLLSGVKRLGQEQERAAAKRIINALTANNPAQIQSLMRMAPQVFTGPMSLMSGPLVNGYVQDRSVTP